MKELNSYIFESNFNEALKLIKAGNGINEKYGIGIRPIIAAINSDIPECLRFVIQNGADVNIDSGQPLHEVIDYCIDGMIQNNRSEPYPEALQMLQILLDNGADLQIENKNRKRPIDLITAYSHNQEIFERLKSIFRPLIPQIDELIKGNLYKHDFI